MSIKSLFKRRLSTKQGEDLLMAYCNENGFDVSIQWKETSHNINWFAYSKKSSSIKSKNYVAYHLFRGEDKYSVWIDLVTGRIREELRQ